MVVTRIWKTQPAAFSYYCANADSARPRGVATIMRMCNRLRWGSLLRRAALQRRFKMKRLLILGAFLLALPMTGCTVTPTPAAQGPPGATGQTGQTGQQGDPGQTGDAGQTGDRGRTGHPGDDGHQGAQGRAGDTGEQGRTGDTGDRGRQGHDAPCPAGEHRSTDRDTGRVTCVRD